MAIGLTVLAENGARLADGPPLRVDHRPPYNGKQFDTRPKERKSDIFTVSTPHVS
jgi:hypothetical protein